MSALLFQPRRRHIGLTALIDVVFILLLFFMLSSTFTRWRTVDFESPVSGTSDTVEPPQIVVLHESGSLELSNSEISIPHVGQLSMNDAHLFARSQPLVLLAVPDTRVQMIVLAIENLQRIGLQQVVFAGTLPGEAG